MKLAVVGYVPPPSFGCAQVFYNNITRFKTRNELILFSDADYAGAFKIKQGPDGLKTAMFPRSNKPNPFAVHNVIFLTGLRIARERGCSHVLYVESDCRVGRDNWDDAVFSEYFRLGRPYIVAGTLSCYNPCNWSLKFAKRWADILSRPREHGIPPGTFGWKGASDKEAPALFPNGALAIYDMAWMQKLWDLDDCVNMATANTAFDMAIGQKLFTMFEEDIFDVVGYLDTVYSGFGNIMTTEEDRLRMLQDGTVVAVHQVKGQK